MICFLACTACRNMMTPYTIAPLKLGWPLKKNGFQAFQSAPRYLSYKLSEGGIVQGEMFTGFGFAESIAQESKRR